MEWKEMKRIILEYSFFPLFESFNGKNGKLISLFGSLSGREYSFLFISLKSQIFIPPKLGEMRGNRIKFNNFFTKISKIPLYIQLFILKYGSNSNVVIK